MSKVIAVAGKGGTGKTTIAGLIIRYLEEKKAGSILAVDADPSSNLNLVLGMEVKDTVGQVREAGRKRPAGLSLPDYLDLAINLALVEGEGKIDLLTMGRPEGKGCYCSANNILRECLKRLSSSYDWTVIDNEAGLEHISRQTNRDVDFLFIISDPTLRGIITAERIKDLIGELENKVHKTYLIVNQSRGELPEGLTKRIEEKGLNLIGLLPLDERVSEYDLLGKPLFGIPSDSVIYKELKEILDKVDCVVRSA